ALAALTVLAGLVAVDAPAQADPAAVPTESWVTNGTVYAVSQVGNRIYVGGSFTQAGPNTGFGVALDPATGVFTAGFPKVNGTVLVSVPDGAGGFYIGGDFTRVGTRSRHNGAHIVPGVTAGTWDVSSWNPETDKPIRAIALSLPTKVAYLGGDFSVVQNIARAGVAAVNSFTGDPVTAFDPGAGTGTPPPPTPTTTSTTVPAGGAGSPAVGPTVGPVAALALSADGTRLYTGGFFTSMAAVARAGLAALDAATGRLDAGFNPSPSAGGVEALALTSSGRLLLGGGFTKIGTTTRNRLAAVTAATGVLDPGWAPSADGVVHTLRLTAGGANVFVGGAFTTVGGSARSRLALLSATGAGAPDATWKPSADADVSALTLSADGTRLFAAGAFTKLNGTGRNYLGALAATGAGATDAWNPNAAMPALALAVAGPGVPGGSGVSPGVVFAGGTFASVNGSPRANLAAFDAATGTLVPGFVANTDNEVRALVPAGGGASIFVGGLFKKVNGLSRSRLAKLDAATGAVAAWAPKASGEVKALAVAGNVVYAGGAFSKVGTTTRNKVAALDAISGALSSWNPNVSNVVWGVAVSPDTKTVYLGGAFTKIGGVGRKNVAAVSAATGAPTTWKPAVTAPLRRVEATATQVFVTVAGLSAAGGNRVVAFNAAGTEAKQWEG
ncbi:MAG TPA: hypothetical protein VGP90_04445, partial [Acidimicrobiia bacterium]|nr:hypothetical protein [Acidimicrobiia bacterium]